VGELETLTAGLCRKLGLSEHDEEVATRLVHMHDLGMLAASGQVLAAPRELTEEERDQLSRWPQAAAHVARNLPGNDELAPALASLGEWWDGSQGLHGLSGDGIPVASRVVAVALAYVAMSRPRPHRAALLPEQILDELRSLAGTRYDPRVVAALGELIMPGS
jgi:HD-GYP domain-containing protein (c-di-GMP phosphodiesterase class II)